MSKWECLAKEVFKKFDADGSGFIESAEVENVLKELFKSCPRKLSDDEFKKESQDFIKKLDQNADGKVSLEEFLPYVEAKFKD